MTPVGAVDQMFLILERRNQPMHVGGLMLMTPPEGAGPDYFQVMAEKLRAATAAQPPFNQRLSRRLGMWFWEEDTEFDLDAHLRHVALPHPGRIRELLALVSRIHSNLLDRAKPLWEAYLIEGIEGGRAALYVKIHHAVADGVAGARMMQRAMTEDPAGEVAPLWAQPPRRRDDGGKVADPMTALAQAAAAAREHVAAIPSVARELLRPLLRGRDPAHVSTSQAPRSLLNQRITGSRRFAAQSWPMARIKAVREKHGVTLNDVVLAMCASALRRYLLELNALPPRPLVAMVPISLRRDDSDSGNQVAMALANLATDSEDPVERLATIARSMVHNKERFARMSQAEILSYIAAAMAPTGVNLATGLVPTWQAFNVVISNVPGPKKRLYFMGARVDGAYPVSIVLDGQALNITLTSYADSLDVGLIACRRTLPSMQQLLHHLEEGLKELE